MRGPSEDVVRPVSAFPIENINSADVRGVYWHMGTNDRMDHADEIGVFIDDDTVSSMPVLLGICFGRGVRIVILTSSD